MKHLYRNRNYRLRNDNRAASEFGRSTDQIRLEQERERARIAREREERMKKAKRRKNTIITLAIMGIVILLFLLFLLKLLLDRMSPAAKEPASSQTAVVEEESSTPEESESESSEEETQEEDTTAFALPGFVGDQFESANEEAGQLGLYTSVQTTNDDTYETGTIMAQDPQEGEMVHPGDTITFYVSLGPAQVLSQVPDLFGNTLEEAQSLLTENGLVLGDVSEDYSSTIPEGSVIGQGTSEGTEVAKGTSVDITISKGPQPQAEASADTASGTLTISQPFTKADENGKLTVLAYDGSGNATKIFENGVSYSTFASLGGVMKVNYPSGTVKIEVYLDDTLLMSEEING